MTEKKKEDLGQEGADIRRLAQAGERTDDPETTAAAISRAHRLAKKTGSELTNPVFAKILHLSHSDPDSD